MAEIPRRGGPLRHLSPHRRRGWVLTSTPWSNSLTSAESARASRQSRYCFGAESTDLVTPTWKSRWTFTRVNMVHFDLAMRDRRGYEFAAVEIFVTRGDGSYCDEC